MPSLKFTSFKLLGSANNSGKIYVHEETLAEGGNLYALLALTHAQATEFISLVKTHLGKDVYASLLSVKKAILERHEFKETGVCIVIIKNGFLYSLVGSGMGLYIVRDGKAATLLETASTALSLISGPVAPGDRYILANAEATQLFSKEDYIESPEAWARKLGDEALDTAAGVLAVNANYEEAGKPSVKSKAVGLIDKLLSRLPERSIVIQGAEYHDTKARRAAVVGILFLVILGVSIYLGVGRRDQSLKRQEYEPQLKQAQHDLGEALELVSLSKTRARELILASYDSAKELKGKGIEDPELTELLNNISSHLGEIAGIYDSSPSLFIDLSIVASNFKGSDMALSEGLLRVLDGEGKRLVGIELENKRTEVVAGPEYLPDALATTAYADRSFILSSDGLREVTGEVSLTIKPEWDSDKILISAFAGNVYILDRGNNQIWRYPGVRGGFLEKEAWLGEGFTIDVTEAIAWSIDGSIWTISADGAFKVYSVGAPATFSVSGMHDSFTEVKSIYTDEESKFVYVLDRGKSRIVVLAKSGQYIGEYTASELGRATDVVVDEGLGTILFLADSKLYVIQAKHLEDEDNKQES